MFKSYTNQRNAKPRERSQQLMLDLPVALPNNIKDNIKNEIFEVVSATPFQKLSISVTGYQRDVEDEAFNKNDRRPSNPDRTTNIGFVKSFDPETNMFHVIIFERYAKAVTNFSKAAMEIIYADNYNGLIRISKFNIIDLGEKKSKKDKKAPESKDAEVKKAAPVEEETLTPDEPKDTVEVVDEVSSETPKPAAKPSEEPLTAPIAEMIVDPNQ